MPGNVGVATIGTTLRQYRIVGVLGKGGMGEVYAADDTKLQRRVARRVTEAHVWIATLTPPNNAR